MRQSQADGRCADLRTSVYPAMPSNGRAGIVVRWVESPVKNRVVLIGDATAISGPSWGCGLSLTLLDVEHLANALCATKDWSAALGRYTDEHDEYSPPFAGSSVV